MKVKELIALLEQCDPEAEVYMIVESVSTGDWTYGYCEGLDVVDDAVSLTNYHVTDYKPGDTVAQA